MERAGGRQAQDAGRRVGCWARARAGRAGVGWRQAQACRQVCGSRRADTAGKRGARVAGRGSRRWHARSVRGRASWVAGAGPGRWARGLGARAGLGQCTRCTWPIFDPF